MTTVFDASDTNFLPCLQIYNPSYGMNASDPAKLIGENDCLKLNLWKPANASPSSNLAVMVFMHGGQWNQGGIATSFDATLIDGKGFLGEYLVDDTVVITIQYRLGVLGFLGSEQLRNRSSINSTGNYGFLDTRLALEWIADNIHFFGGDRENVFIFGESMGAGTISGHMMSKGSWPYFASAGMESGAFNRSPGHFQPMENAEATYSHTLAAFNCTSVGVACLLEKSYEDLYMKGEYTATSFSFIVDGEVFTQSVTAALESDSVADKPILMGTNLDEAAGLGPLGAGLNGYMNETDLEKLFCNFGPNLYTNVTIDDDKTGTTITTNLAEQFAFSKRSVPTPPSTISDIVTEEWWVGISIFTAHLMVCDTVNSLSYLTSSAAHNSPVFVYEFRAQNNIAPPVAGLLYLNLPPPEDKPMNFTPVPGSAGVYHASEMGHIWNSSWADIPEEDRPYWTVSAPDGWDEITEEQKATLSATMGQAWINFAKNHDPGFNWQPWTTDRATRAVLDYNTNVNGVVNEIADYVFPQCKLVNTFDNCTIL